MSLFKYLRGRRNTASVAKERLQIIISHERTQRSTPDYLPELKKDILTVLAKYFPISEDQITVSLDRQGDSTILELNVTMPEATAANV